MSEPDLTTEIIGYRQWYVTPDLELRAAGHKSRAPWKPGENEAICRRAPSKRELMEASMLGSDRPRHREPCGDTPGSDCQCGFYALHDPSDFWYGKRSADPLSAALAAQKSTDPLVSGVVVAWGKVEVHHQGFRSQYARVAALALPKSKREAVVVRAVAADYGALCVPVDELPRIALEFGSPVPVEMRPEKQVKREVDELHKLIQKQMDELDRMRREALRAHESYAGPRYLDPPKTPKWWERWGW